MIYLFTLLFSLSAFAAPSAYVKVDSRFPLGEVNASRLLSHLKDEGYRSITIEAPAIVNTDESAVYFGSRIRPGTNNGISTFIQEAKSFEFYNGKETTRMEVVLKLSLYMREETNNADIFSSYDATKVSDIKPYDGALFYQQYLSYVLSYAKLAQKTGVDVLVIGSNLGAVTCASPSLLKDLVTNVRRFYKGSLRLDFPSIQSLKSSVSCVDQSQFASFGVDLLNPSAQDVQSVLSAGYEISYLGFEGTPDAQSKSYASVLKGTSRTKNNVTFGFYSTDPQKNGVHDTSAVITKKPSESIIKKWLN